MDPITQRLALGAAGAGGPSDYWIDQITYSGGTLNFPYGTRDPLYVDANNNLYNIGEINSTSPKKAFIVKRDYDGVIQWARTLSHSTYNVRFDAITSDDTYLYCAGYVSAGYSQPSYGDAVVAVYDLNGNLQWQKTYARSARHFSPYTVRVDSSGNIFLPTDIRDSSSAYAGPSVVKLNSSGVLQWVQGYRYSGGGWFTGYNPQIEIDSSGNIIVFGSTHFGGTSSPRAAWLAKMNGSTGALIWANMYAASNTSADYIYSGGLDSSGNIYAIIFYSSNFYIAKWNSSGTLQAAKTVYSPGFSGVHVDHEDNVWVFRDNALGVDLWDTNLNLQFSREFINPSFSNLFRGSTSEGIHLINGASPEGAEVYLPLDGSLTGSYPTSFGTTFQYNAWYVAPSNAPTFNTFSGTTSVTRSVTESTSSFTDAADSNFGTTGRVFL